MISIVIPPLRDRRKDISLLAHFFLDRAAARSNKRIEGFDDEAMKLLVDYDFPGNVRELENIVERSLAMARGDTIQVKDLPSDLSEISVFSFEHHDLSVRSLREVERDYIQWILNKTGRNKTKAAKLLGINRASLWRHLRRHEIDD